MEKSDLGIVCQETKKQLVGSLVVLVVFLGQIDKKYKEVNQKLLKQHGDINYVKQVNGSLDLAKNIIEAGSNEEIISLGSKVKVSANNIEKECPKMMQPVQMVILNTRRRKKNEENFKPKMLLMHIILYPHIQNSPDLPIKLFPRFSLIVSADRIIEITTFHSGEIVWNLYI